MNVILATLRGRMVAAMIAFAVVASAVTTLLVVAFAYGIEDAGFNDQLDLEVARQRAALDSGGGWTTPTDPALRIVARSGLPEGLAARLDDEPGRVEYTAPSGRHYHFRELSGPGHAPAWLLYDVTDRLIVRPAAPAMWALLGIVAALTLLAGAALALWLSERVTRPLSELVRAVRSAEPDALELRLPDTPEPTEVAVLTAHLQALMVRLRAFIAREQSFTRDASHEIRTPLAVMRVQLDHLLALRDLPASMRVSLISMHDGVSDLQRIVETLLWLAREEARPVPARTVAVRPVVERAIADQWLQRDDRELQVDVAVPDDARMTAPPGALLLLISSLVGNAFNHATAGRISIGWDGAGLVIRNPRAGTDPAFAGPGDERAGFGLAIVRRVAERSGLAVSVRCAEDDFEVRLSGGPPIDTMRI